MLKAMSSAAQIRTGSKASIRKRVKVRIGNVYKREFIT
jgi:hypothetical protein